MTNLTIVMAVYGQPQMLATQLAEIRSYGPEVCSKLRLIVVDDCGDPPVDPREIEAVATGVQSAKLFRIEQDIPWNQMGARNLGMHHAEGWCMMLDPDMVFPASMMVRVMEAVEKLERGQVIKFALRHFDNKRTIDMTSPNTWIIHRDDFFHAGGYDEDYAGSKGWSDVQLLDILTSFYKIQKRPDLFADFYGTQQIPDAMVKNLDRSTKVNRRKRIQKVAEARAARGWIRWVRARQNISRLRFPWKQVYPPA